VTENLSESVFGTVGDPWWETDLSGFVLKVWIVIVIVNGEPPFNPRAFLLGPEPTSIIAPTSLERKFYLPPDHTLFFFFSVVGFSLIALIFFC